MADVVKRKPGRPAQGRWVGYMLYPDNDDHMRYMAYMMQNEPYPYIWILHHDERWVPEFVPTSGMLQAMLIDDKFLPSNLHDIYKKDHIHFMRQFPRKVTAAGAVKKTHGVISHCEIITDPVEYAHYLLHIDFASMEQHKPVYDLSDIRYSSAELFNSLYCFKSTSLQSIALPVLRQIRAEGNCLCFDDLLDEIYYREHSDPALHGVADWACRNIRVVEHLFPHFAHSLNDLRLLEKRNSISSNES